MANGYVYLAKAQDEKLNIPFDHHGFYYFGHTSDKETPEQLIQQFNQSGHISLELVHKIPARSHWLRWAELVKKYHDGRLMKSVWAFTLIELTDEDVAEIKGMRS